MSVYLAKVLDLNWSYICVRWVRLRQIPSWRNGRSTLQQLHRINWCCSASGKSVEGWQWWFGWNRRASATSIEPGLEMPFSQLGLPRLHLDTKNSRTGDKCGNSGPYGSMCWPFRQWLAKLSRFGYFSGEAYLLISGCDCSCARETCQSRGWISHNVFSDTKCSRQSRWDELQGRQRMLWGHLCDVESSSMFDDLVARRRASIKRIGAGSNCSHSLDIA